MSTVNEAKPSIELEKEYSAQPSPCKIGNPAPLITVPNVVVGMAIFCGGLAQLLAGMWEFPRNNAFGAAAFTSYGAFWMSYATILLPGSGIASAYPSSPSTEFDSALGIYLITWFIVTFLLLIASFRKNVGLVVLFAFLAITFLLLAAGLFTGSENTTKAGGAFGAVTAFVAYYVGLADLLAADGIDLPLGKLTKHN